MSDLQLRNTAQLNFQFLINPMNFLRTNILDMHGYLERSMLALRPKPDFVNDNQATYQFAIEPIRPGTVGVGFAGRQLMPAITGRFLGFQFNVNGPGQMGHIVASASTAKFIFTVGITGCTIIGVRKRGTLTFYHEPTRANDKGKWLGDYDGDVVIYAPTTTGYGSAVIHCYDGRHWCVYVQSLNFDNNAWTQASLRDAASRSGTESRDLIRFCTLAGVEEIRES